MPLILNELGVFLCKIVTNTSTFIKIFCRFSFYELFIYKQDMQMKYIDKLDFRNYIIVISLMCASIIILNAHISIITVLKYLMIW